MESVSGCLWNECLDQRGISVRMSVDWVSGWSWNPQREFNPEHIGIRIDRTDLLLPDYLFYALTHVHQSGHWKQLATGTLSLVNIRVSDVRSIELSPR
ncbi:hypothetical protein CFBP3846_P400076 (plasmid) [Pseudomonas syringae pv. avii]|uniref:Uncharacterized protein n=1 Tax=Pseudomonas syringae pv. avii TaxID=663959 RepID=A0ABY1UGB4_PSESX|nr:hypothetical protein CFBP3846_P400076 [Pseudomonas syringae pv. avii]